MFVGGEKELAYLNDRYYSMESEFVVLYGRRRIGKTELIKQFIDDKRCIFYSASEVDDYEQLKRFSSIVDIYSNDETTGMRYQQWDDLFRALATLEKKEKLVIVIDEFPYMVNSNKSIPSILQNLWDHLLKEANIMLVLSGSSVRFMENDVLGANNPLYGRTTGVYKLNELPFSDAKKFFPNYSTQESIQAYSILGGVPQYLRSFDPNDTVENNIKKVILEKGSKMYDEVNLLLKQELRETSIYFTLLEAIAFGNTKLNDIHQKTQIDKTKIIAYLNRLIKLDVIEREFPVTEKLKKKVNVQSGLYKIRTNFFKFFFHFVFPYTSMLELGASEIVYKQRIFPLFNEYVSTAFEEVCKELVLTQNIHGELSSFYLEIGRWWEKQAEIDIVGIADKDYFFGECKWKNSKMSEKDYYHLQSKISASFFNVNVCEIAFFSKSGFTDTLVALARNDQRLKLYDYSKTHEE